MQQKAKAQIEAPTPVPGLSLATESRLWLYDPSVQLTQDLKDHKGNIFYKAGTSFNPLKTRPLTRVLLFFDGADDQQIAWAQAYSSPTLWILVAGTPLKLAENTTRAVYFDQGGALIKKFGIKHLPASVRQEGNLLRIEEHVLLTTKGNPS